jgi:hypothetical protein
MDNSLKKCIYAPDTAITREMLRSFFRPPPRAKKTRGFNAAQDKQKARGAWLLERHLLQREMDKAPGADQRFTIA